MRYALPFSAELAAGDVPFTAHPYLLIVQSKYGCAATMLTAVRLKTRMARMVSPAARATQLPMLCGGGVWIRLQAHQFGAPLGTCETPRARHTLKSGGCDGRDC